MERKAFPLQNNLINMGLNKIGSYKKTKLHKEALLDEL
tara:strand:+ start:456 stop:569 length:114 start_codon:yes stop_codon:yes gene_type:complete